MKCPRCGSEMILDNHRKIPLNMCYNCGYIEGRTTEGSQMRGTHFDQLKTMNLNEAAAFLTKGLKSKGLEVNESAITDWLLESI